EAVWKRHELRALAEVAVAAPVAVARGDRGGAERAAVIAALEREVQTLTVARVAHQLQRVLHGLRAADVEVHAALQPEALLVVLSDAPRELDLLLVQVLARDLRQGIDLPLERIVQSRIGIA